MRHDERGFVALLVLALLLVVTGGGLFFLSQGMDKRHHAPVPGMELPDGNTPVAPIPEPGSVGLFIIGAALVGGYIYKNR